jgi:hypothetical protein
MTQGQGEWEIIRNAAPKFDGHYQPRVPLWGYANDSEPIEMERKIDSAADHGVNVFIFDWYWYNNQPFLENSLNDGFLKAKNNHRIHFYLMWANHDATTLWDFKRSHRNKKIWSGTIRRSEFDKAVDRVIDLYFSHPSYYKIDGKPVFSIYDLTNLIKGLGGIRKTRLAIDSFREKVKAKGFPDLHLQAILWGAIPSSLSDVPGDRKKTQDNTIRELGFDSLTNYQWCHYVRPKGKYKDWGDKAILSWEKWRDEFSIPFFPHVSIGWDTNPRFIALKEDLIIENTPTQFGSYIRNALDFIDTNMIDPPLLTVNSWNEWSEGSYLEPDTHYGMLYLEAIQDSLKKYERKK